MCKKKSNEKSDENLFFEKVKESMLKLCEKNSDIVEFQLFKKKLEQAKSFGDLEKNCKF